MRSLILTIALMVASLGAVAITPDKADARPPRWYGYYGSPYYSSYWGPSWSGGSYWRGGTSWQPRYYSNYYSPRSYYYGSYYYPRSYGYYGPRSYYWP